MKELDIDQMEMLTGGVLKEKKKNSEDITDSSETYEYHFCRVCNKNTVFRVFYGKRGACTECGWILTL